ncbi:TonB-dependent receptor [Novosphingobium sp. 9]|uniref:TonB-dependent receptor n=1 Tax=Novosphingobium sp. 9 TaxID=2025349 RepID=UPI0021B53753|nr:TonB-dependent receptor [Novosphingobium sp. 9]
MTARKRSEDILKTPVAITAMTGEMLESRGIASLDDLANYTPSMSINSNSSGRSDRSFQSIIIRGFTPAISTSQTASLFIDGVPVSSSTAVQNLGDPARVEVLKGPQSAYFGRQTFAGAVNVVTQSPPDEFGGWVKAQLGTNNNREVAAQIGGPLIDDVLSFSLGGRYWGKDGSYGNKGIAGQTLGDQTTRSANLALKFTPSSNFTAKVLGLWSENIDGPSATALIPAYSVTAANGTSIVTSQSNCNVNGNAWFCGTAPKLQGNQPSANTANTQFIKNFLSQPNGRLLNPEDGTKGYGLRSRFYHLHLAMDWDIGSGLTLSSLTGYNDEIRSTLSDLTLYSNQGALLNSTTTAGSPTYFAYPYLVEYHQKDVSQEFRMSLENGGPLHLVVGASYLYSFFQSGGGGSPGALGTTTFSAVSGSTDSNTYGAFFGLTYDLTSRLSLSVDGRYQIDELAAFAKPTGQTLLSDAFAPAGTYAGGQKLLSSTYHNFMPRAILNFNVSPNLMLYTSYAKGINPGAFNVVFLTQPATTQQAAADAGLQVGVRPETLSDYELGAKGKLFGGAVTYSVDGYYGIWNHQLNSQQITVTDANGVPQLISATVNSGKVRVWGLEAELNAALSDRVHLNASGSLNDTYILQYASSPVTALTGMTSFRGKQLPNAPKYSGSIGAQYDYPLDTIKADLYMRGDFVYRSGLYSDVSNLVKTQAYTQFDMRAGIKTGKVKIEAYVTNVFNNKAYSSIGDYYTIDPTFAHFSKYSGLAVGLRDLRTFGLSARYDF